MLDAADPQERAKAAEALVRSGQMVEFDPGKPADERTLPGGFLEQLAASSRFVVIRNAVFPAPCFFDYMTLDAVLILQHCGFSSFSAIATTFKAALTLTGSSFESCVFRYGELLEAGCTGITVSQDCWFDSVHVKGLLNLSGSTIETLVLAGAQIDGEIVANEATVTTLYAQGLSTKRDVTAAKARFRTQVVLDDLDVAGGVYLQGSTFDSFFKPARNKVHGSFILDGVSFAAGIGVDGLTCATFSMTGAKVSGNAAFFDLDARNVMLSGSAFAGGLHFERGSARGVFMVSGVTVAGDFLIQRTVLEGGTNLAGVEAASLQLVDVECGDVYADDPAASGAAPKSRFGSVAVERSKLKSLRPAQWSVAGELAVRSSTIDYALIEGNDAARFVVTNTKFTEACLIGENVFHHGVQLANVFADGSVVFQHNTIDESIDARLCTFGRLDFQQQSLPPRTGCTSSTVKQLMFDETTSRHALTKDGAPRYAGRTIDLESSTYDQIICNVAGLTHSLAPKASRQQFVVLERALRQSGFDELGDAVYRFGRTRYYERVKNTDFGVWLRGAIANWTTGYGLSVTRITLLTIAIPLVLFALVLLSPGAASESEAARGCAAMPQWTTAAAAVGSTYLGEGSTAAHLTECRLLGLVPAHGLALPLRLLGMILVPIWLAIATGILKYAVKS